MSDLPATLSGGGFATVEARSFYDAPIRIFVQHPFLPVPDEI